MKLNVSIPHRFNSQLITSASTCVSTVFQSLTGSIHKTQTLADRIILKWFQSLTGSIHMGLCHAKNKNKNKFQSLTGSIHNSLDELRKYILESFNPSQVQFTLRP